MPRFDGSILHTLSPGDLKVSINTVTFLVYPVGGISIMALLGSSSILTLLVHSISSVSIVTSFVDSVGGVRIVLVVMSPNFLFTYQKISTIMGYWGCTAYL